MLTGYEVLRRLSEGVAAEVLLARPEDTQERVVVEVVRPELVTDPQVISRILEEAHALQAISHPNVAQRVVERTTPDGQP